MEVLRYLYFADVNDEVMLAITGDEKRVYRVDDFDQLGQIFDDLCSGVGMRDLGFRYLSAQVIRNEVQRWV